MEEIIREHTNYWKEPGVPHKGWEEIDVEDVGFAARRLSEINYETCEMCGNERIRYVHTVEHKKTGMVMRVGCVCAEKMTEDYANPRGREKEIRNRTARFKKFMNSAFKRSGAYSYYADRKGYRISITKENEQRYSIRFDCKWYTTCNHKPMQSLERAKYVAFDMIEKAPRIRKSTRYSSAS